MISSLHSSRELSPLIQGWDWEVEAETSLIAHEAKVPNPATLPTARHYIDDALGTGVKSGFEIQHLLSDFNQAETLR